MSVPEASESRLRAVIRGAVQGVGFRPFVYRLAKQLNLSGWVCNSPTGVELEVEGAVRNLQSFRDRLMREKPPRSSIQSIDHVLLDPVGFVDFTIRPSETNGRMGAAVMPDIATCADCLREVFDSRNRRYRYPFTNCTNCGPRYSIIEAVPYDRPNTTMKQFAMCETCRIEYDDPHDRRFHAQPNACPACGPTLTLLEPSGQSVCAAGEALLAAAQVVRAERILAVKGIGGFHLIVDARRESAVRRLRERKSREAKPFALMATSVALAREFCEVSELEESLLTAPEAPIVLLKRRSNRIAEAVAPGNPYLGVMLPYTPLHHLLVAELTFPIVVTSGNLSDEPICTDNHEALDRLGRIADGFLVHDRPIARRIDDSIVRVVADRAMMLRRARGYAPLPISLDSTKPAVLAVGAHQKNTTAITVGSHAVLSQHLGDLESPQAFDAFRESIAAFDRLYRFQPAVVACDLHPDYRSTRFAETLCDAPVRVPHHFAHVLSCMVENEIPPPVLGVSWDGTGYGPDGTIWGGEFLLVGDTSFARVNHLRRFRLPGGERAVREPRRSALGVLDELFKDDLPVDLRFSAQELQTLRTMIRRGVHAPLTSSAGRLFDAVGELVGLRRRSTFEGQAAMELEFAVEPCAESYDGADVDWEAIVRGVLADRARGVAVGRMAGRFHNSLVEAIIRVARQVGEERVVLTGGCFQNKYLSERAIHRLRAEGFRPYWHQRIPPNDGGIALGQIVAATREFTYVPGDSGSNHDHHR